MKKAVIFFALLFFAFSFAPVYAQHKVRAKGMATVQKNFVDIARSKALDEAQRNAVEKAVGVMITSTTNVENFQVKMDRILSESKGFITSYNIISEKRNGDNYEVEIEAEISAGRLRDKMTAINLIMERKSKPRVMLVFAGQTNSDAVAEAAMSRYFMEQGFKVVDAHTVKKNKDYERLQDAAEQKVISGIAHRYGAEVIIICNVDAASNPFKINDVEMNHNKVVISGKIINGDNGGLITTGSEQKAAPGMKGDFKKLTDEVATKLARNLVDNVLESWSSELANTITVKLVVSGLNSYSDLQEFKSLLSEEVKGFKSANQRYYSRGKVELDLEIEGDAQAVAHDVEQITVKNKKMKVLEISPNRVEAVLLR
ncbi:MAG TPA: flagellar assembly protein T N-terminal domain-containing protein [Smithellaceae bacterium]|nr:flagellar assembly protein T N-terminal domain-containing protein [Smithellaceae bacterium]